MSIVSTDTESNITTTQQGAKKSAFGRIVAPYIRFSISRRVPQDRRQDAILLALLCPLVALLEIALAFGSEAPEGAMAEVVVILLALCLTLIPWMLLRLGWVDVSGFVLGAIISGATTVSLFQPLPNGVLGLIWAAVPGFSFLGLGVLVTGLSTRSWWSVAGFALAVAGLLAVVFLLPHAPSLIQEEITAGSFPASLPMAEQQARTVADVLTRPLLLLIALWLFSRAARWSAHNASAMRH